MIKSSQKLLIGAMLGSVAFHAFAIWGVGLVLPDPKKMLSFTQPLQVVLVNSKSKSKPVQADALAQANLDGGGNTEADKQAKTPLPTLQDDARFTPEQKAKSVAALEAETQRLLTQLKNDRSVAKPEPIKKLASSTITGEDLLQKSLEIIRLEAQIDKNHEAYQKLPRRKFIGARTQEYRFAQYIEDWRVKIERIGNLNYPEQARSQQLFGKLQLSVSIRANGTLENVEVDRSSGHRILDAAAVRIVKLAAPYAPLPDDIKRDTDILTITRTWSFTQSDHLESE
ncbi:MAG: energy transducer TonB [Sideroxydans sp.]|nr:energy transducer TonB [Sideroxydans sp.]